MLDRLKYHDYILIIKKTDGYYCNTTDCFTELFTVTNMPDAPWSKCFQLNLNAKMMSTAEYETAYKREHGEYSSNYQQAVNAGYNTDVADGPRNFLSYILKDKKGYKFWLLDNWSSDGIDAYRGMDPFNFDPEIGITGAAYEFYMRKLTNYYYHNTLPKTIKKGTTEEKELTKLTPYFSDYNPILLDYLNEEVILNEKIEKL